MSREQDRQGGVQSVEIAGSILRALVADGGGTTIKRIAETTGLPSAKIHRYLVSLVRAGLVARSADSPRYVLGQFSLELGLAALGATDAIAIASAAIAELRDDINETVVLTVWGSHGPTIVRFTESSQPVTVNVRVGTVLPLLRTALGRIYASFLETDEVSRMTAAEAAEAGMTGRDVDLILSATRKAGLAGIEETLLPGVSGLAAPVFDYRGRLVAVIGVIGRAAEFDIALDGKIAVALSEKAAAVSRRLGYETEPG